MSKSIRKHTIFKYGCSTRESWKSWRTFANRYNRRIAKRVLGCGEEHFPKARKLCSWDWDFCKWYFSKNDVQDNYKLKRK